MKNDRKCVQCGKERVEGSTLCVDCLSVCAAERADLTRENKVLKDTISLNRRLLKSIWQAYQELQDAIKVGKKEVEK